MPDGRRWSDNDLEQFLAQFIAHLEEESPMHRQQSELYAAVFRKEDKDSNTPPGLLQLTARISQQMEDMKVWQDRHKTFLGGAMFALSCLGFFFTDIGHKVMATIKGL